MENNCIKIPNGKTGKTSRTPTTTFYELIAQANGIFGEGQWSHSISNQTIDFTDNISNKYYVGCATTVKVALKDDIFHEDIGYSCVEGPTKGITIMNARMESINNGLQKVFSCFDYRFEENTRTRPEKAQNDKTKSAIPVIKQEDCGFAIPNEVPFAHSTPYPRRNNSPELGTSPPPAASNNEFPGLFPNVPSSKAPPQSNAGFGLNQKEYQYTDSAVESISEEEINRLERKRRQLEKQKEFQRQMQEKEKRKKLNAQQESSKY